MRSEEGMSFIKIGLFKSISLWKKQQVAICMSFPCLISFIHHKINVFED